MLVFYSKVLPPTPPPTLKLEERFLFYLIRIGAREIGCVVVNWINLVQKREECRAHVKTVTKFRVL
jgi:hypothetical protein